MLKVGDQIPQFSLENQDSQTISSQDFSQKITILYFYPKDNTPGCTTQAIDFTNSIDFFNNLGVSIYGISPDSVKSHQKFCQLKALKIQLLADEGAEVSRQFGVYGEKKMYGRTYLGVFRTTFIVGNDLTIFKVYEKVKVPGHIEELKKTISSILSK